MNIQTYVPKDIEGYEEKILFGLSVRQITWGSIGIVTGVGFYMLTYILLKVPQDICIFATIAIAFVLFALGWAKWEERRPFSDFLKAYWRFLTIKQKVIYSDETYYFERKDDMRNAWNKTREDKKINKRECREYKKAK